MDTFCASLFTETCVLCNGGFPANNYMELYVLWDTNVRVSAADYCKANPEAIEPADSQKEGVASVYVCPDCAKKWPWPDGKDATDFRAEHAHWPRPPMDAATERRLDDAARAALSRLSANRAPAALAGV